MIDRILDLIKKAGITAKQLTEELELSNSAITEWKKGKAKPSIDAVMRLAAYFNVSTDYILIGKIDDLSEDEKKVLFYYNRMEDENQDYIKGEMIRLYKQQEQKRSEDNTGQQKEAT